MNTILTYLRTLRHGNIVSKAFNRKTYLVTHQHYLRGSSSLFYVWSGESLSAGMNFKNNNISYGFDFYENTFDFTYGVAHDPFKIYQKSPPLLSVAKIFDMPYDNTEEVMFQQSLVNDMGQFGLQEALEMVKIKNAYFGRLALETKTK